MTQPYRDSENRYSDTNYQSPMAPAATTLERLYTFAEAIPQLVWMAEPDGAFTYFNKRWIAATGLSIEASKGDGWQRIVHPEDRATTIDHWEQHRRDGKDYELEHRLLTQNGERWMLTRAVAVRDKDEKIIGWFGTVTDIDEHKRATAELQKLVVELEKTSLQARESRNELKELAHTVAYELQSQMRTITSVLRMLSVRYKGRMGEDADNFISQALGGGKSVERSLDGLWILSQIEKPVLDRKLCNMQEILEQAKYNVQDLIDERQANISADRLPEISANAMQIEYLLQQLLENAITFSSGTPTIHCSAIKRDNRYTFALADSGIGFDMMDAERIFAMYFRLDKNTQGTGMGLTICRRIVEAHGGRIWAKSEPGKGTVIYFTLD
ncbi:MAG: PAS domain S-box protein [Cyanobacteria bacterium REEB67]|nr:PAS domain S-box protein [Cyanobacteria bacterium REEB67]